MFKSNVARAGGACIASLTILLLACSVSADTRPNVILVMADDMGWAQTGYYGYPLMKTPNLDDMARNGLRMDRFYAGAPSEEQNLIDTYPDIAARRYEQFKQWSLSVSRSALGADYPEGRVHPTGREPDPVIDERKAMRIEEWAEEVRAAEASD